MVNYHCKWFTHRFLVQQILSELGPLLVNIFHDRNLEKNIPEKLSN
jgi:hypothetical protein